MCEHLGRCSAPGAYNTSAGSAEPLTSRPSERIKGGQGELDLNLSRRNGKRQSGRNQATGRQHAALDRLLLRPTETYAGDPDHCRMMDDSPNDPGVANAWDSSDARGAYEDRPPRAA